MGISYSNGCLTEKKVRLILPNDSERDPFLLRSMQTLHYQAKDVIRSYGFTCEKLKDFGCEYLAFQTLSQEMPVCLQHDISTSPVSKSSSSSNKKKSCDLAFAKILMMSWSDCCPHKWYSCMVTFESSLFFERTTGSGIDQGIKRTMVRFETTNLLTKS